jgi:hypothetical protein
MALPLIAAGIAARAVAKKLATRAVGGITGAGAKQVTPVYREMGTGSVKVIRRDVKQYPDDLNELMKINTSRSNIIKVNSNPTRAR